MVVAAVDCCCWLLLVVVAGCCCWLLLLIAADCCWLLLLLVAVVGCSCWLLLLEYCSLAGKSLNISRLLLICGQDNSAGEKVFEFFQDTVDLHLRQFCRRKSLWIFPGYCWFAAKTILQAKRSLNSFREKFLARWWRRQEEIFRIFKWELGVREFRLGELG